MNTKLSTHNVDEVHRPSERQLKLLGFLSSRRFSDEEIRDIQNLIADYYADKAQIEMDAFVAEKRWTQEDFDRMANEHIRTPYDK
ncbi:MAG: hypothetical protein WA960_12685 [Tunicatimonas sp.]